MKKIPTIFKRNEESRNLVTSEPNDACGWVFAGEGIATRKYDGTCVLFKDGVMYKRREVKKGKIAPDNFILVDYDPITEKRVGWVPVDHDASGDRHHTEALVNYPDCLDDGTYELLGPKVNKNQEEYVSHGLMRHDCAEVYDGVERTFTGIRDFLADKPIEGIVFHHPDGRMAKIKKRDFGLRR